MATAFFAPRVWETGAVSGSSPISLPGTAKTAFQTFAASGVQTGDLVYVCTVGNTSNAWEASWWTFAAGSPDTLTRATFGASSTGAAINYNGETCDITLESPPPSQVSGGIVSAGGIPALNASGYLDGSVIGPQPYDLGIFFPGKPAASQELAALAIDRAITLASGFAGSAAVCGTAPAASYAIAVLSNGVSVGTINFAAGATTGTFSSSGISIASGDLLSFQAPATADATMANISITLSGAR